MVARHHVHPRPGVEHRAQARDDRGARLEDGIELEERRLLPRRRRGSGATL
jgi:hypothetical protein